MMLGTFVAVAATYIKPILQYDTLHLVCLVFYTRCCLTRK